MHKKEDSDYREVNLCDIKEDAIILKKEGISLGN